MSPRRAETRSSLAVRDLDPAAVEAELDNPFLMGQRLIHFALAAGVTCFGLVIAGLHIAGASESSGPADDALPRLLSYVHPVLFVGSWLAGNLFHAAKTGPGRITRKGPGSYGKSPEQLVLANIAAADLLRVAMMEGVALFGLVVCLISHLSGALAEQPLYWFNATSAVLMVAFVVARFPSKERYAEIIRQAQVADRGGV